MVGARPGAGDMQELDRGLGAGQLGQEQGIAALDRRRDQVS